MHDATPSERTGRRRRWIAGALAVLGLLPLAAWVVGSAAEVPPARIVSTDDESYFALVQAPTLAIARQYGTVTTADDSKGAFEVDHGTYGRIGVAGSPPMGVYSVLPTGRFWFGRYPRVSGTGSVSGWEGAGPVTYANYTLGAEVIEVPWWALALPPLVAAGGLWWWAGRSRRRAAVGMCPACGYDLRATPGRCPECGRAE